MTFTSNIFLLGLFPWFIGILYLTRKQKYSKKILLILFNSIFYIWGGVGYFLFVCGFSIAVWIFSNIIRKSKNKFLFGISIFLVTIPLIRVKYTNFFIENINSFLNYELESASIVMPIGISFFTFQAISLLSDIFLGKIQNKITLIDVYLYLTFFPTITSGPIIRFENFNEGLKAKINCDNFYASIERIGIGVCKKLLIADKLAILSNYFFDGVALGNTYSAIGLWCGSIAYTLQLYFDFSGYSDMAIGIGKLMGFEICENFNKPYQSSSISEFWKRWHISLSNWFRDYIYIPLGGNRCTVSKHIINMLIVWLLTGIWHGAGWNFIVWGLGYFILLVMEKYIAAMKKIGQHWWGHIYTLFFVNLLWIPFRATNLNIAIKYITGMFGVNGIGSIENKVINYLPYLVVAMLLCLPLNKVIEKLSKIKLLKGICTIALFVLAIGAIINSSYTPYIYGNF